MPGLANTQQNIMVSAWDFPQSVIANGREYAIRTDYRDVINLMVALNDPELKGNTEEETKYIQARLMLEIMVIDHENINEDDAESILNGLSEFIDMGVESGKDKIRVMDWEQDAGLIVSAINNVLKREIRAERYMHWWTFLSAYFEIGESTFSHILNIRTKRAKGKKLEKWEKDYIEENKNVVLLRNKLTEEEQAEREKFKKELDDLLG